jgi:hypothetical protein
VRPYSCAPETLVFGAWVLLFAAGTAPGFACGVKMLRPCLASSRAAFLANCARNAAGLLPCPCGIVGRSFQRFGEGADLLAGGRFCERADARSWSQSVEEIAEVRDERIRSWEQTRVGLRRALGDSATGGVLSGSD